MTTENIERLSIPRKAFAAPGDDPDDTILLSLTGSETALVTMGLAFVGAFTEHADRVDRLHEKLLEVMCAQRPLTAPSAVTRIRRTA